MISHRSAILAALLMLLPGLCTSQTLRGVAVDRANTPVPGIVALLIDSTQSVVARSLSNERGEFRLVARIPGTYRLRTLRIGFRPVVSDPIALLAGRDVVQRVVLTGVAVSLDTLRVVSHSACHLIADSAAATFAVWEQVRAALTATQLSAAERSIQATTLSYERLLDKNADRVRSQRTAIDSRLVTQPWLEANPDSVHRSGYVFNDKDSTTYLAPGLDVLLSNTFQEDHCMRLASSPDSSRIGIEFEPTSDRRGTAEVRGTLWVDRKAAQLRSLEFRYANVLREQEQRAGGEMEFIPMRNGMWAVSRWDIRMPLLGRRRTSGGSINYEAYTLEVRVTGGDLILATRGNDTLWSRPPLTLIGSVSDSASGAVVRNAFVRLSGTQLSGVTDSLGQFSIRSVLPGVYTAEVRTPALDAIGAVSRSSLTFTDSATRIALHVASAEQMGSALCGAVQSSKRGIVVGTLTFRGVTASPGNVRVFASYMDAGTVDKHQLRTVTDVEGKFRICGVPTMTSIDVQAEVDSADAPPVTVRISDGIFAYADLVVDKLTDRGSVFTGRVVTDSTFKAIGDAEVSIPALSLSERTDERGTFRFTEIPAGTYSVVVRHFGYGPLDAKVVFEKSKAVDRRIVLTRVTTLDSVRVVAQKPLPPDFEENRKLGLGHFFTREELAKQEGRTVSAVLAGTAGLRLVGGARSAWVASSRGPRSIQNDGHVPTKAEAARGAKIDCYARVYLDDRVMYNGKAGEPLFDVNSIRPESIEGIEYYAGPAQTPLKYSTLDSQCGVLVIWTRRTLDPEP